MLRMIQALVVGLALNPSAANAEEPRRFTLDYQAGASCPDQAELLAEIRRRIPNAERALGGSPELHARLKVATSGGRQLGSIDVDGLEGFTHREVEAAECAEVVRALALILAIALDPDSESPTDVTVGPTKPSQVVPNRIGPALSGPGLRWAAGASVGFSGGVAPGAVLSEALFVELRRGLDPGWSAHVRLEGVHAHGAATADAGTANFDLLALRVASCPYRVGVNLAVSGCASFDWGRLQGSGSHTRAAHSESATWVGPGAFVAAELSVLPRLRLQLELGGLVPLVRDSFYFGPTETVHRIPDLAGFGALNLLFLG